MVEYVYLDYNASARIRPQVAELIAKVLQDPGNASSVHRAGQHARKYVETARSQVAALMNVRTSQVIFNAGATEGINTILCGYKDKPVLISAIEHPAVIESAPHATHIPVTTDGVVDIDAFKIMLEEAPPPALVCVMLVNSETGVIQPVKEIAALAKSKGALVMCDAVQAAGRIPVDFKDLGVDYLVISAHKMAGPQGVGALIFREGLQIPKFMCGGGQESFQRAGTHNTAGIAGMGLAAALAAENINHYQQITDLRDHLETQIRSLTNRAVIYGQNAPRVGNTSNIGLEGVSAQTQLMTLDLDGFAVSSGSACSSGAWKASHVLTAMGANADAAKSALRISLGWATTSAEIDAFLDAYKKMAERLTPPSMSS